MARTHPPSLLKLVERTLAEECGVRRGSRLLLAVSGGPDSLALLHAMSRLRARFELALYAHGVDHGLRSEAGAELDLAERLAQSCGIAFSRSRVEVVLGGNLQARARQARYQALRRVAAEVDCPLIATGHHADDRAETVLSRLLRGAGPRGLAVLPPRSASLVRPLVRARRRDILAHLSRHGLAWAEDPSNADRRYLRVRIRTELLPLLEAMSPQIVRHLNALADQLGGSDPPVVVDEAGVRLELGRSHIDQLRRAQALRLSRATILLPGGKTLGIDRAGRPVLSEMAKGRSR
jgi:tRNA(Ile)-lysidine synthase